MNYTATISEDNLRWQGEAYIPLTSGVDKFADFAMHGLGPDRYYEQGVRQKIPLLKEPDL